MARTVLLRQDGVTKPEEIEDLPAEGSLPRYLLWGEMLFVLVDQVYHRTDFHHVTQTARSFIIGGG